MKQQLVAPTRTAPHDGPIPGAARPGLEIAGLAKRYGDVTALDGCSLTVRPGRVVGLLGPNGAGKTTTMRCIFGLVAPDRWRGVLARRADRPRGPSALRLHARGARPVSAHAGARSARVPRAAVGAGSPRGRATASTAGWRGWGSRSGGRRGWTRSRTATSSGCSSPRRSCTIRWRSCSTSRSPASTRSASRRSRSVIRDLALGGTAVLFSSHQLDLVEDVCQDVVVIDHGRVVLDGELERLRSASSRRYLDVGFRGTDRWIPTVAHARVAHGRARSHPARAHRRRAARDAREARTLGGRPDALQPRASGAVGPVPRGGGTMTAGRRSIALVAWREISERASGRAFMISTIAIVAVVLAGVILPALNDRTTRVQAGITGATPAALAPALRDAARADDARLELRRYPTVEAGETAVRDGQVDVLIVGRAAARVEDRARRRRRRGRDRRGAAATVRRARRRARAHLRAGRHARRTGSTARARPGGCRRRAGGPGGDRLRLLHRPADDDHGLRQRRGGGRRPGEGHARDGAAGVPRPAQRPACRQGTRHRRRRPRPDAARTDRRRRRHRGARHRRRPRRRPRHAGLDRPVVRARLRVLERRVRRRRRARLARRGPPGRSVTADVGDAAVRVRRAGRRRAPRRVVHRRRLASSRPRRRS